MKPLFHVAVILAISCIAPRVALAHLPFAGLNDLYNGLPHPVVVAASALLVLAFSLQPSLG